MNKAFRTLALVAATACLASGAFAAEKKTDFKVAWSVYSGWMPGATPPSTGSSTSGPTSTASTSSWCS